MSGMLRLGLLVLNAALLAGLAALWVNPATLQWRDVRWSPPAPLVPELGAQAPATRVAAARHPEILDRPLFSPTRRPPPPEQAQAEPAAAPQPDPLKDVHLFGIFEAGRDRGAILRIDGDVQRVRVGESVAGWTLREVHDRQVVLVRQGQSRTLDLAYADVTGAATPAAAPTGPRVRGRQVPTPPVPARAPPRTTVPAAPTPAAPAAATPARPPATGSAVASPPARAPANGAAPDRRAVPPAFTLGGGTRQARPAGEGDPAPSKAAP